MQVFSCDFHEIFKNTFFKGTLMQIWKSPYVFGFI